MQGTRIIVKSVVVVIGRILIRIFLSNAIIVLSKGQLGPDRIYVEAEQGEEDYNSRNRDRDLTNALLLASLRFPLPSSSSQTQRSRLLSKQTMSRSPSKYNSSKGLDISLDYQASLE